MSKWNMIVDVAECHNCHNCFIGCKDEYVDNSIDGYSAAQPLHGHRWIDILSQERGRYPMVDVAYLPVMCNHCDNAPCVDVGRGAVTKRSDGIVLIDPVRSVGRKDIVDSCPYGAIWWNDALELPQAWTFDAHLLDRGWKEPRCVQSCPTGAMKSVKASDDEMARLVKDEGLRTLLPEKNTKPRVYYKNLHLYDCVFIGGVVLSTVDGVIECVAGAVVSALASGNVVAQAETDAFGEFKLDGFSKKSGKHQLVIDASATGRGTIIDILVEEESLIIPDVLI